MLSSGVVKCWGYNYFGQLGNGSTNSSSSPVSVSGISNAILVSAGVNHTCAMLSSGAVQCWGYNNSGSLGNGSTTSSSSPVSVSGISNATSVSVGYDYSCAMLSSGAVQCWGWNTYGQLGNGSTTDTSNPVSVIGISSSATSVSAGDVHSCAVLSSGAVQCWGENGSGQLGNGNTTNSQTPVAVTGLNLGFVGIIPQIKLATADSTGIRATIVPTAPEIGQPFPVYAGAAFGPNVFLRGSALTAWTPYQGFPGEPLPVAQQVPSMPASLAVDVVTGDISRFAGMDIYAAYGDLSAPGHAAKLLTIQKRTTVYFPNAASPISMASLSPFGGVIATRRDVAGSQNVLDVIEPDGTYYQFSTGVNGLPQVVLDGFTISVLATDAMGLVSQVGVKEPNGTFTAIDKPVTVAARSIALRSAPSVLDCNNLTDVERELVCRIVLHYGHPSFELIRGAYEILRAYYARGGEPVVAAVVQGWNYVSRLLGLTATLSSTEVEVANTGAELVAQGTQSSGNTAYTFPDVPNVSGSNEAVTRQIAADTKKIANNQRDLITMDTSRVGVVNGSSVTPAYCASNWAPIKGVCFPLITSISPKITVAGQATTLIATGSDLTNGMGVQLFSLCNPLVLKSTGTNTSQQVTCTPSGAGTMAGDWSMAGTGSTISKFSVTVCEATQTIVNGACFTADPVCVLPQVLQNHVCAAPSPSISSVTPAVATVNQPTTFVATGTNLSNGLDIVLQGCTNYTTAGSTGSSTRQQFTCTPTQTGQMTGFWNEASTGRLISQFTVTVSAPVVTTPTPTPTPTTSACAGYYYCLPGLGPFHRTLTGDRCVQTCTPTVPGICNGFSTTSSPAMCSIL